MNWLRRLLGIGGQGAAVGDTGSQVERIPPPPPDPDTFWTVIGKTTGVPQDKRTEALAGELKALEPDALVAFDADYRRALAQAYRWDLWAAAYVINGGCSDDGFDYFRDWLISRGRAPYDAALDDPSSLIAVVRSMPEDEFAEFEEFRYVVQEVYERKTGTGMPVLDMGKPALEPAGEEWDEDEVGKMFPELERWANERE